MNNLASTLDLSQIWTSICLELQQVVSADAVTRWFRPLRVQSYANKTLTLSSDNSIYQYWIEENYLSQLKATASRVLGENVSISFQCGDARALGDVPDVPSEKPSRRACRKESPRTASRYLRHTRSCLNPRNTFHSFVVGMNNQFSARRRAWPSPRPRPAPTTRSSFTAASVSARPTSCRPSAISSRPTKSTSKSSTSPPSNSPTTISARSSTANSPSSARATARSMSS